MKWLAIDTSTDLMSVALKINNEVMVESVQGQKEQAQQLLPIIHQLLNRADINIAHLDGIAFGRGPGSFTGIRIACSVVKGLAYPHNIPVYPVSTLATITQFLRNKGHEEPILSVIDARMQELYWGFFPKERYEVEEKVSAASEIQLDIDTPFILAGVGFAEYEKDFSAALKANMIDKQIIYPHAAMILTWLDCGIIPPLSAKDAKPLYVRNTVTQGVKSG